MPAATTPSASHRPTIAAAPTQRDLVALSLLLCGTARRA
jgi:hypothetical protein